MPSAFTEFCIKPTGSNLNAGTLDGSSTEPGDSPAFQYASGDWDGATVFTVASGNPLTDGVQVGQFASVYPDGSSVTPFIGRITAVDATTITVSATNQSGTPPVSGSGTRTLRVGGAWAGPSGAVSFVCPQTSDFYLCCTALSEPVRLNIKGGTTYSHSALITLPNNIVTEGYTTTYGDGGFATFDHAANNITAITMSNGETRYIEVLGTAGTGFTQASGYGSLFHRCRTSGVPTGFNSAGLCNECEAYNATLGFRGATTPRNCYSHGCTTGFYYHNTFVYGTLEGCIADSCGRGFDLHQGATSVSRCDAYNCSSSGFYNFYNTGGVRRFVNCNAVKCGVGFNGHVGGGLGSYALVNCGFGGGAFANTANIGSAAAFYAQQINCVQYTTHPWNDPDSGDFTVVSPEAMGAGNMEWLQSYNSKTGTLGTVDIGAAQSAGGGGLLRVGMNGGFGG